MIIHLIFFVFDLRGWHKIKIWLSWLTEKDSEPYIDELSKVIGRLSAGKAPSMDGIPPDLLKHYKIALLLPLHKVLARRCRTTGHA